VNQQANTNMRDVNAAPSQTSSTTNGSSNGVPPTATASIAGGASTTASSQQSQAAAASSIPLMSKADAINLSHSLCGLWEGQCYYATDPKAQVRAFIASPTLSPPSILLVE
jgi:hypothetical protein